MMFKLRSYVGAAKGAAVVGGSLLLVYGVQKATEKFLQISFKKASELAFK